ncbi:Type IV secretory system Conjugative DNA transfer [Modestobacter sp. DSM 44400]|uniref:type IV secretory system conjugative DNA transfer family protein n=1 Tax=Modestobacter sp. DSM 44400 TaxID=1550230 RepID=UPI00089BE253|nr:TraM recognition domain-containing protein [Modestobacter sp. DSM 44400]SDY17695.1 Type IV secretory system Conjugative DNA transfer [Modestobacter sp. DSM 44400]
MTQTNPGPNQLDWLTHHVDPWYALLEQYLASRWSQKRLWLGVGIPAEGRQLEPVFSDPERNCLWLGPPKSHKSHGGLAPQAMAWNGPAVILSVKKDLAEATALVRARFGDQIQHLDPTGGSLIDGAVEVRFSPIAEAGTWGGAQKVAAGLAGSGTRDAGGSANQKFWESLGAAYMAVPLYAANLDGRDMRFVLSVINGVAAALDSLEAILTNAPEDHATDAQAALDKWNSLSNMGGSIKDSIVVTSTQALNIYDRPETLARSLDPNFNAYDFISTGRGELNILATASDAEAALGDMGVTKNSGVPLTGVYPTLYVTASTGDAEDAQAIMRTIIRQFWDACRRLADEDRIDGITDRRPLLLVCDELTNLAPDPAYPSMVSQSVDQGLVISAAIQDLGQVESRFGRDGDTFLTLHNEVMVLPGIKNEKTLTTISNILGKKWIKLTTHGSSGGAIDASQGPGWSVSESWHEVPVVPINQVRDGLPGHPNAVLRLPPTGFEYLNPSPLWGARPWPQMIVSTMEYFLWRTPHDISPAFMLPIPELDRINPTTGEYFLVETQPNGRQLLDRYMQACSAFIDIVEAAEEQGEEPRGRWVLKAGVHYDVEDDPEDDPEKESA